MDFKAVRRTDKNVGVRRSPRPSRRSPIPGLEIDAREPRGRRRRVRLRRAAARASWRRHRDHDDAGRESVSPFFIANMLPDTASGQIAIELGIKGPNMCIVTACSTGTHNIGEAAEGIRRGDFVAAITGSTETPLLRGRLHRLLEHARHGHAARGRAARDDLAPVRSSPATGSCWARARARWSSRTSSSPRRAARGSTPRSSATARRPTRWDLIQPIDKGDGTARAMEMALERHGVPRDEVDLINPHGTSTPLGDLREAQAIWRVFGDRTREIAISGTKSMTGHLMGAAGAVEGFTVLSVAPPDRPATLNYRDADPEIDLDVVHGEPTPMRIRYAIATTSASAATTARSSSSATTATDASDDRHPRGPREPIASRAAAPQRPRRKVGPRRRDERRHLADRLGRTATIPALRPPNRESACPPPHRLLTSLAAPSSPAWGPSRRSGTTTRRTGNALVAGVSGGGPDHELRRDRPTRSASPPR